MTSDERRFSQRPQHGCVAWRVSHGFPPTAQPLILGSSIKLEKEQACFASGREVSSALRRGLEPFPLCKFGQLEVWVPRCAGAYQIGWVSQVSS